MRDQLVKYVELLFAGTTDTDEIRQEILQNTLDRYDDLLEQGKSPEAAYRLAISGIGDINEIVGENTNLSSTASTDSSQTNEKRKLQRAVAIAMYILSVVPVIALGESEIGVCLTLLLVAAATALIIISGNGKSAADRFEKKAEETYSPKKQLQKAISSIVGVCGLCVYLIVSFVTGAWYITWLIFPILGAVKGLVNAIIDLKEAINHEN